MQQAIAFALSEEALEIGTRIAKNDNANAIAMSFALRTFISLIRWRGLFFDNRLADEFHFALRANAARLGSHVLVHRTNVMKLSFCRLCILSVEVCVDGSRIHASTGQKQRCGEQRQHDKA